MRPAAALLPLPIIGLLLGGRAVASPAVSVDDLARCAAIRADTERLACYDRLSVSFQAQSRTPSGDSAPRPKPAQPADAVQTFGLSKQQLHEAPQTPEAVTGAVKSISTDANGNVYVLLDNGQTWTFADANALLRVGDTVVVKRAALGSFLLSTPSRRTYRVRRIK
jgi:hypothetical protein